MDPGENFLSTVYASLNREQRNVFDECINGSDNVFCTGQGGTGKSWLLECVVRYFREYRKDTRVAVTASTGIASFNIGGMTFHRFVGAGIEEDDVCAMHSRACEGMSKRYWTDTHVLIVDEVSMISAKFFENASCVGSMIRENTNPFGGIRVLMFGDFLQLPPVSRGCDPERRVFHTDVWSCMDPKIMQLTSVVRQSNDMFKDVLSGVRYGICTELAQEFILSLDRHVKYEDDIEPVRLFARRDMTDTFNETKLATLPGDEHVFHSIDKGNTTLLKQCPAPKSLSLKVGCQVIVIRNIDSTLVNGSVGTVIGFTKEEDDALVKPVVKFTDFKDGYFERTIGRVPWESVAPNGTVLASRKQYPLILSWAITIHRSQGATIPRLCIDMSGIFEVGQAYVALSRCPNPRNLQVVNFNPRYVVASRACVHFYQEIARNHQEIYEEDPPEYSSQSRLHGDSVATSVADVTQPSWETDRARQAPERTLREETGGVTLPAIDALSLGETSRPSP